MTFEESVDLVGKVVDAAGVLVIVVGVVWASFQYLQRIRRTTTPPAYTSYRRSLGRAILVGLEFLVASDIIRTVATEPTYRSLGILGAIIGIRTFLSLEIEMEIEGRWPWQQRPGDNDEVGTAEGD